MIIRTAHQSGRFDATADQQAAMLAEVRALVLAPLEAYRHRCAMLRVEPTMAGLTAALDAALAAALDAPAPDETEGAP